MFKTSLLLTFVLLLSNCASINSVSLTPIPPQRNNPVQAQVSKTIILGFNFDNDFVDSAVEDLKNKCPNGRVTGLLTKDENINYFLYIVWKKQITAKGFCVAGSRQEGKVQGKPRSTASEAELEPAPESGI